MSEDKDDTYQDLDAETVYLLMNTQYRISRNRRAEWFFTRLNTYVAVPQSYENNELSQELDIISVVPKKKPSNWNANTSHLFRYRICPDTIVSVLSKKYRFVYCIDISPSVAAVDVQASVVMFDAMFDALKNCMKSLIRPFYVPGSTFMFQPKFYVTVIAHTSFLALNVEQILVQGVTLNESTYHNILQTIFTKLHALENKVVGISTLTDKVQSNEQAVVQRMKSEDVDCDPFSTGSIAMSPDFALVDLFRHAVIALALLPENSAAGLIIITDGATSVPDGGYLDMVLSQLRYNTVTCSFIQLSSPFHPHVCYGMLPYTDFMKFIANATSGAFLTSVPNIESVSFGMNAYHESLLIWNFQKPSDTARSNPFVQATTRPGVWSVRNKCFSSIRDMPIVKKQQYETTLIVDYLKVLSCRLREGFIIKDVNIGTDNTIKIKLVLAWKFLIQMEYILITQWPPQQRVTCILSIEGPYDFLHDVTCLAKKPFQSYYRQLMVSRFWGYQKNLSESDKLLVHFNSFSTLPTYYNIPDSLKNGVPLFFISPSASAPVLQSSDFAYPQFAQFWKPVCLLDTNIWQKWMHTHRIGVLLEHDHPFPKHLHLPNSSGRFHVIQCRQTMMALNTLLKDWSSFVLVENHSYIKLMYSTSTTSAPTSFCLIRTTTKPPCLVLRLAFLVGTPGHLRHSVVSGLLQKIAYLTFPQRLNEPPKWRISNANTESNPNPDINSKKPFKRTWSDIPCCIVLKKPIEKILIRYERVPNNFFQTLLPQQSYNSWPNIKRPTTVQSTFGFRPTYSSPWGTSIKMGPEMFNTVARYLKHKRWIWCVQSTPTCPLSMECAARILSTITKMRLQEGLRFAFSAAGVINMVKELDMKVETYQDATNDSSNNELISSPCVLQYVLFPPVTSLFCADGEEEIEKSNDEENSELYLVCECWVEPQSGTVVGGTDLDGVIYSEIHDKIFEIDQECISALITFEHLNLMCQNSNVPSPTAVPERLRYYDENNLSRELKRPKSLIDTEEHIKYVPFSFDLTRILPKSQQVEVLFSTFNQMLQLQLSQRNDGTADCYDQANTLLYSSICSTLNDIHDREVIFASHESRMIHEHIHMRNAGREESSSQKNSYDYENGNNSIPKWKCFIKGITDNHVLLTFIPATFRDLKLFVTSRDASDRNHDQYITHLASDMDELVYVNTVRQKVLESSVMHSVFPQSGEPIVSQMDLSNTESQIIGRKRSRVKSGGESGPVSKKALTRKRSIDNLFRARTNSVDQPWRGKHSERVKSNSGGGCKATSTIEPSLVHTKVTSALSFDEYSATNSVIGSKKTSFENARPQYGSLGLPLYIFDCSLATVTDHIIFRTNSTMEDICIDSRYSTECEDLEQSSESGSEGESLSASGSPMKHRSPEPKSEDSELPPCDKEALQNHCRTVQQGFEKSFICGLFRSLQVGHCVCRRDVELALRLCQLTKIQMDMTEFIHIICEHSKESKQTCSSGSITSEYKDLLTNTSNTASCDRLFTVHKFIQRRFQHIIMSTFENISEVPGVYFFKLKKNSKLFQDTFRSIPSTGTFEFEDFGSSTNKCDPGKAKNENFELIEQMGSNIEVSDLSKLEKMSCSNESDAEPDPLFMYLICTYTSGESSSSFLVQEIPTCLEVVKDTITNNLEDITFNKSDLEDITSNKSGKLSMEFLFLTIKSSKSVGRSSRHASKQFNQAGRVPLESHSTKKSEEPVRIDQHSMDDIDLPSLPLKQVQDVKQMIEEAKWLLRDEITSFKVESHQFTEGVLASVASHIENSTGKPGCKVANVPLSFVSNTNFVGYEKFKKRFSNLAIEGFQLQDEGSWFYLHDPLRSKLLQNSEQKFFRRKVSGEIEEKVNQFDCVADVEGEDYEIAEIDEKLRLRALRKLSGQELRHLSSDVLEPQDNKQALTIEQAESTPRFFLSTPTQLSEISSLLESVNTNGEEGYDGDGSDSGDEGKIKREDEEMHNVGNAFWMIFKLTPAEVKIFFHCRYNEEDLSIYNYSVHLFEKVVRTTKDLKRLVNQDLLLHELENSRQCNILLESEANQQDILQYNTIKRGQGLALRQPSGEMESDTVLDLNSQTVTPGLFSCPVVWETKFIVHARLRTGPGKSLTSRGIQTLRAALLLFEVVNRKNMFVYKDSAGNVFYLRLYRIEEATTQVIDKPVVAKDAKAQDPFWMDSSSEDIRPRSGSTNERELAKLRDCEINEDDKQEDIVLLQVHGITPAGSEIKEQLVQSLRNKLDDAVLDILSITLDRNPHCKLTPEDVHFIQKPDSKPDYVVKFRTSDYVSQNLPAFGYYMHQNLMNFFSLPKYTDQKPENRFRDYTRVSDNYEKNIYLYKQNPGDTGSRGIACLVVSVVDSSLHPVSTLSWSLPSPNSQMEKKTFEDFLHIATVDSNAISLVELQVWKQGRINLDLLRSYISLVIKQSIWDLVMEFYYLTAPLSIEDTGNPCESTVAEVNSTKISWEDPHNITIDMRDNESLSCLHERRSSVVNSSSHYLKESSQLEQVRGRSVSFSVQNTARGQDKTAPMHHGSFLNLSPRRAKVNPLAAGLNPLETGDKGQLHPIYTDLRRWCDYGNEINVPSLLVVPIDLNCHHPVEAIVHETEKLVSTVMTEIGPKQFWKSSGGLEQFVALGGLRNKHNKNFMHPQKDRQEFNVFTSNLNSLDVMDPKLLSFFRETDDFDPFNNGNQCIIVARNMIHWKACISATKFESYTPDVHSHHYKFPPLLAAASETSFLGLPSFERSQNTSPAKTAHKHPILIARQKFLWINITDSKVSYLFYNWPKESSDRLIDNTKRLSVWINARSSLLTSIYSQKAGLFQNQAIIRSVALPTHFECGINPFFTGGAEIDTFILHQTPPKSIYTNRINTYGKRSKVSTLLLPCLDSLRNLKHHNNFLNPPDFDTSALKSQFIQVKVSTKIDSFNYQDWLQRNISSSNGEEVIHTFKKSARLVHHCMTPIIFFPRWRREIAATRDNLTGIRKKTTVFPDTPRTSLHQSKGDKRSRHESDTSQKSIDSSGLKPKNKSSIWSIWGGPNVNQDVQLQNVVQSIPFVNAKKNSEKWQILLCESFMKEYVQYLQTLGFIPISGKISSVSHQDDERERIRQISGASVMSSSSSQSFSIDQGFSSCENISNRLRANSGQGQTQYLQKNLPGGIILFEDVLGFLEECEKVKILMHLHSFTYDFHLRSIHAYIAGRQVPFKPGYHLTNFLDDFIKYYAKGPNFARNTVYVGMVTLQNISTPSHILYDYMLAHEKVYEVKVLSTNTCSSSERNSEVADEYVLVKMYSKKVTYNHMDEERQYDEFDLIVLIAYDAPLMIRPYSSDPSVLRLKYYIILTSRRDIYPTLGDEDEDQGKISIVNTPVALCPTRVVGRGVKSTDQKPKSRKPSVEERARGPLDSWESSHKDSEDYLNPLFYDSRPPFTGIKAESIHYMGYFTSHEQVMQQVVAEQVDRVESFIHEMVGQAAIDCRRDLLWQRLLIGEKPDDKQKNRKEDLISRETVGALSYWEFVELLELVQIKSLSEMDPRLISLLRQPIYFYQSLLKLITFGNLHCHRYFVAPDESTHHVALFCNRVDHAVVMLEINFEKRSADLSVLFKKDTEDTEESHKNFELEGEILNLVESVINMCCYCAWANLV